jgi:hypothetical protein
MLQGIQPRGSIALRAAPGSDGFHEIGTARPETLLGGPVALPRGRAGFLEVRAPQGQLASGQGLAGLAAYSPALFFGGALRFGERGFHGDLFQNDMARPGTTRQG